MDVFSEIVIAIALILHDAIYTVLLSSFMGKLLELCVNSIFIMWISAMC